MPQKLLLSLLLLVFFHPLWSQDVVKDSVWVSFYKDSTDNRVNKNLDYKYSSLFNKVYKLPTYAKKELENFNVNKLPHSLDELLRITYLNNSYSANEVKGTSLEKSLREYEQFSYPFSAIITSNLAQQIELSNNKPELIAHKGNIAIKTTKDVVRTTEYVVDKVNKHDSLFIQQNHYLRYRLLDFLVGSYAKKIEDVKWIESKTDSGKVKISPYVNYYDNQFLELENGYKLLAKVLPDYKHLQNYTNQIKNLRKVSKPLFGLDVNLLSTLDKKAWDKEVTFIKKQLSHSFVNNLIYKFPKPSRIEVTEELLDVLEQRIANLDKIANEYYNMVTNHKIVLATEANDIIVVDKGENYIRINIFKEKEGKNSQPKKSYTFSVSETKSIWVYGLKGNDYFEVKGKDNAVKIDLIGGKQLDKYEINSGKNVTVYDSKRQTNIIEQDKAKDYLTEEIYLESYKLEKHNSRRNRIKPILGANPDDGIFVGLTSQLTINKFKRKPFTQYHDLQGVFYTGNAGFKIDYYGELAAILFKKNVFAHFQFHSPNYSTNFFGYGNDTPNYDDNLNLNYNRVKMSEIQVEFGLKDVTEVYNISASLFFEQNKIDPTPDRFVSSETLFFPEKDFFEAKNFTGIKIKANYAGLEFDFIPELEIMPSFFIKTSFNFNDTKRSIVKLDPSLFLRHPLYNKKIWLESTVAYQQVFGSGYEFYQAAYLGASNGLRGLRNQRFTGRSAISLSTDVKWNVKEIKSEVLPLQFGLLGGADIGRVWVSDESSSTIHTSYGSGFWLQSADLLKGSLMVFGSQEGLRFNFNLSFGF